MVLFSSFDNSEIYSPSRIIARLTRTMSYSPTYSYLTLPRLINLTIPISNSIHKSRSHGLTHHRTESEHTVPLTNVFTRNSPFKTEATCHPSIDSKNTNWIRLPPYSPRLVCFTLSPPFNIIPSLPLFLPSIPPPQTLFLFSLLMSFLLSMCVCVCVC